MKELELSLTKEQLEYLKKSKSDILYFTQFVYPKHPKLGYYQLSKHLYPKQKEILTGIWKNINKKYIYVLAARQSGKTTLILTSILHYALFNSSKTIAIVANKENTAKKIFRRLKIMYEKLPNFFKFNPIIYDSKLELEFADGTLIYAAATGKSGLRSETLDLLYLDEFAIIHPPSLAEEFWDANFPTVEHSKGLIISSTPKGKQNKFYELYKMIEEEKPEDWVKYEMKWNEVFIEERNEKWRVNKIKELGSVAKFEQEYNCSFEYIDDGWVDEEIVKYLVRVAKDFKYPPPQEQWFEEPDKEKLYLVGIDLAEGKGGHFSAMEIFSYPDLKEVYAFADNRISIDKLVQKLHELIIKFNKRFIILFENNDVGKVFSMRVSETYEQLKKRSMYGRFTLDREFLKPFENYYITPEEYKKMFYREKGKEWFGIRSRKDNRIDAEEHFKILLERRAKLEEHFVFNYGLMEEIMYYKSIKLMKDGSHFDRLKSAFWAIYLTKLIKEDDLEKYLKQKEEMVLPNVFRFKAKNQKLISYIEFAKKHDLYMDYNEFIKLKNNK